MATRPIVLGVAGEAGSGKDTVCDHLVTKHGFVKVSLAAPLKKIVASVFPAFPDDHLYGASPLRSEPCAAYPLSGDCPSCGKPMRLKDGAWRCRPCGFSHGEFLTPRLALQTLGTEWGRRLYRDVWVDYLFSEIGKNPSGARYCISDVRFPNEVSRILVQGGKVIRLKRKSQGLAKPTSLWDRLRSLLFKEKKHASEAGLDSIPDRDFHAIIQNDADLDTLFSRVDGAVARFYL